jgi:hypothetical protein
MERIGRSFRSYGEQAGAVGLTSVPLSMAFDLVWLACRAFERRSAAAGALLEHVLALDHNVDREAGSLLVKAKVILGGFLLENRLAAGVGRVGHNLRDVPAVTLAAVSADLLAGASDWVPPERRQAVEQFLGRLRCAPEGAGRSRRAGVSRCRVLR